MKSCFVLMWSKCFQYKGSLVLLTNSCKDCIFIEILTLCAGVSLRQGRFTCCTAEGYFVHLAGAQE